MAGAGNVPHQWNAFFLWHSLHVFRVSVVPAGRKPEVKEASSQQKHKQNNKSPFLPNSLRSVSRNVP